MSPQVPVRVLAHSTPGSHDSCYCTASQFCVNGYIKEVQLQPTVGNMQLAKQCLEPPPVFGGLRTLSASRLVISHLVNLAPCQPRALSISHLSASHLSVSHSVSLTPCRSHCHSCLFPFHGPRVVTSDVNQMPTCHPSLASV